VATAAIGGFFLGARFGRQLVVTMVRGSDPVWIFGLLADHVPI
jgi:hypothetical protein